MPNLGTSKWGRKFTKVQSGVVIPNEMVKGQSRAAFSSVADSLAPEINAIIRKMTGGIIS